MVSIGGKGEQMTDCELDRDNVVSSFQTRDVTKFAFEFDNVRTSNVFSRFEIRHIFSRTRRRIRTSGLHDRRSAPHVYTHRPLEQPTEQMRVA